jgi:cell fate (sporulation/competence/biofilm development) regulator YlbF (YheA/YmcA/DUF963 family)
MKGATMHDAMMDKAQELGRLIGQTGEYRTLERARESVTGDRELNAMIESLSQLEAELAGAMQRGEEPSRQSAEAYENALMRVQANSQYQSLVAAQSNFDKLLGRVNDQIGKGMEAGSRSRIILPD